MVAVRAAVQPRGRDRGAGPGRPRRRQAQGRRRLRRVQPAQAGGPRPRPDGDRPDTVRGFHAYYKGTEHQRNGHIPGVYVDFRSQGGYVVAPPSRIAGRDYEVVRKQPSADTFDWAAAKQVLDPQPERQPYKPPERDEEPAPRPGPPPRLGRQPARRQPQSRAVLGIVPRRRGRRHGDLGQPRQRGPVRRARRPGDRPDDRLGAADRRAGSEPVF